MPCPNESSRASFHAHQLPPHRHSASEAAAAAVQPHPVGVAFREGGVAQTSLALVVQVAAPAVPLPPTEAWVVEAVATEC